MKKTELNTYISAKKSWAILTFTPASKQLAIDDSLVDLSNPFFYFEGKVLTGLTKYFHKIRSEKFIRRKLIRHIKKLHSRHDMKREFTYEILLYDSLIRILKKFCLVKQFKLSNCIPRIGLLLNSCQNTSKSRLSLLFVTYVCKLLS